MGYDTLTEQRLTHIIQSFNANRSITFGYDVTHIVTDNVTPDLYRLLASAINIPVVVTSKWLRECYQTNTLVSSLDYELPLQKNSGNHNNNTSNHGNNSGNHSNNNGNYSNNKVQNNNNQNNKKSSNACK